jgi:hypothetical protein
MKKKEAQSNKTKVTLIDFKPKKIVKREITVQERRHS